MIDKCLSPFRYRTWLIKYFLFIKRGECVKELGQQLRILRKSNGVSKEEASSDLGISTKELECLENGNLKVFKDVYELKKIILNYAKYLGIDENKILDEFNDFLFEKTSKISKEDIKNMAKEEIRKEKVSSPYTKLTREKHDYAPIVLLIVFLIFISLVVYLVLSFIKKDSDNTLMLGGKEVIYEFTK